MFSEIHFLYAHFLQFSLDGERGTKDHHLILSSGFWRPKSLLQWPLKTKLCKPFGRREDGNFPCDLYEDSEFKAFALVTTETQPVHLILAVYTALFLTTLSFLFTNCSSSANCLAFWRSFWRKKTFSLYKIRLNFMKLNQPLSPLFCLLEDWLVRKLL